MKVISDIMYSIHILQIFVTQVEFLINKLEHSYVLETKQEKTSYFFL